MAFQQNISFVNVDPSQSNPAVHGSPSLPTSSWLHSTPSVMPWTMENPPRLMRFGEMSQEPPSWEALNSQNKYLKRKQDFDFCPQPAKVHLTEEKMAAQLKNMHISKCLIDGQGIESGTSNESLPTLVLSKEVQNLSGFMEPSLPESLVPKINKPTKALVLWKPPAGSLTSQIISSLPTDDESDEVDQGNNTSSCSDLSSLTYTEITSSDTELEM